MVTIVFFSVSDALPRTFFCWFGTPPQKVSLSGPNALPNFVAWMERWMLAFQVPQRVRDSSKATPGYEKFGSNWMAPTSPKKKSFPHPPFFAFLAVPLLKGLVILFDVVLAAAAAAVWPVVATCQALTTTRALSLQ